MKAELHIGSIFVENFEGNFVRFEVTETQVLIQSDQANYHTLSQYLEKRGLSGGGDAKLALVATACFNSAKVFARETYGDLFKG